MNRHLLHLLPSLLGTALILGGCATTRPVLTETEINPNNPQTFLAGADVQQAKSVAMGSAVTKGWRIVDSQNSSLRVRRPIGTSTAKSVTGGPVAKAQVEVRADFNEGQGGVKVILGAALITDEGTKTERTVDYTDSYKDELVHSLDSLRRSWEENRWRVASSMPSHLGQNKVQEEEGTDQETEIIEGGRVATSDEQSLPGEGIPPTPSEVSAPVAAPVAAVASVSAEGNTAPAPVHEIGPEATPTPIPGSTESASPAENMLALNRATDPGVWAYYAEHYAKARGCELSGQGTYLEEKQPEYEIHRVSCTNGQGFRVKCNAGTCRGLE